MFELMTFIKVWSWIIFIVTGTLIYKETIRRDIEMNIAGYIIVTLLYGASIIGMII